MGCGISGGRIRGSEGLMWGGGGCEERYGMRWGVGCGCGEVVNIDDGNAVPRSIFGQAMFLEQLMRWSWDPHRLVYPSSSVFVASAIMTKYTIQNLLHTPSQ